MKQKIDFTLLRALFRKQRQERLSAFKKNFDFVGFVMRIVLYGALIAVLSVFLARFADMYLDIMVNYEINPAERAYEVLTLCYSAVLALMVLSVILTSAGISIEVRARAWMLAGEMTVAAIAETGKMKFRNVKIAFDISLVIIAAAMSMLMSGHLLGDGQQTVIREGTLVSALFTGYLMRFLDPLTDRLLRRIIPD